MGVDEGLPDEHIGRQVRFLLDKLGRKFWAFGKLETYNLLHCDEFPLAEVTDDLLVRM